jgi:hypothetical protein
MPQKQGATQTPGSRNRAVIVSSAIEGSKVSNGVGVIVGVEEGFKVKVGVNGVIVGVIVGKLVGVCVDVKGIIVGDGG